jgi:hypothetical protein
MKDTFTYWEGSSDGELLMQFSQDERNEYFHSEGWVIEEMKKLDKHIDEISKFTKRTKQEIADFLFWESKESSEPKENAVIEETQEKVAKVIENSKVYIQQWIDFSWASAEEPEMKLETVPETKEYIHDIWPASEILWAPESQAITIETPEIIEEPVSETVTDTALEEIVSDETQTELKAKFKWYDIIWELIEWRRRVSKWWFYWFLDEEWKEVVRCVYETVNDYCEGAAVVCCDDGTYWYINMEGRQLTECKFLDVMDFSEWLAAVKLNNKWWFIDKDWRVVIKYEFNDTGSFKDWRTKVVIWRQEYFINRNGQKI